MAPLSQQRAVAGSAAAKIRLGFLGTALVDALGGPAEFHRRFTFPVVKTMIPNGNFGLSPGTWTDDTSMALCLARSIAKDGFSENSQLSFYDRWFHRGELSAVGSCFDIGNTTRQALGIYGSRKTKDIDVILSAISRVLGREAFSGNGSLMRLLPVPLAFWQRDRSTIMNYAKRSSITTHPSPLCIEACELWSDLLSLVMKSTCQSTNDSGTLSKLDFIHYIAHFPYSHPKLKQALSLDSDAELPVPSDSAAREKYYEDNHPLIRLVKSTTRQSSPDLPFRLPSHSELPSSGFVLHSLVAALFSFFATDTFEQGALVCVNLGEDADTVGAIYGGLAAIWYGSTESHEDSDDLFWNSNVRQWNKSLVACDLVATVAEELVHFAESQK